MRQRKILANKNNTLTNINFNVSARSMKGVLKLFKDATTRSLALARDTKSYYNPKIMKVDDTIKGVPN